jgi:uncharacterized repeat protein (TIGR01451 family)
MEKYASEKACRIKLFSAILPACLVLVAWVVWLPATGSGKESPLVDQIKINELDSDTPSTPVNDAAEFVELYDGGAGGTTLTGLVLVFYNGATDTSYRAIDLDGFYTDLGGYFLAGNAGVSGVDLTFPSNTLQNGADVVALYLGNGSDFPNGTTVVTNNLVDAVVYDTGDDDDIGLLGLLNPGQPQVDEDAHHLGDQESIQRCPNGSGLGRNTDTYITTVPTPGQPNCLPIRMQGFALVQPGQLFTYTITVSNYLGNDLMGVRITDTLPANVSFAEALDGGIFAGGVVSWVVPALADRGQTQVRFRVYASEVGGVDIINRDYAVQATNFTTPTYGFPFITAVDGRRTLIRSIQGAGHLSPLNGLDVDRVFGIVTALKTNGFYLQDPAPDIEPATSEGIFVYTAIAPQVFVGDALFVKGRVLEYRPDGTGSPGLTITEIVSSTVLKVTSGNPLPDPVILGSGGRNLPGQVIEDDAQGDVESSGIFDPGNDGIDFYESLEGMLVEIRDPIAVGPTDAEGWIPVVVDGGVNATILNRRGGIVVRGNDVNPERIIVEDVILTNEPKVSVGTIFSGTLLGVMDYNAGNFRFVNISPFPSAYGGVISETISMARTVNQITIATINLENLDPADPLLKFDRIAREIVFNLDGPDLIAIEEVQDNSGTVNDAVVSAALTFSKLIQAIQSVGGVQYDYRQIDPVNNADGGDPGGNIRQAFLFRTDRGLSFVDRAGGTATTSVSVTFGTEGLQLSYSPGRIDPNDSVFSDSRKPLAGEFLFNGNRLFVIANHFNSKQGDDPLFGRFQPPSLATEMKRVQQAQIVNQFSDSIVQLDPNAQIILLGDFNDFPFSTTLDTLSGGLFSNLVAELPAEEQYSYLFEGNSQAIDHILVSPGISAFGSPTVDIVHMNAEFLNSQRPTDHDPVIARINLPGTMKTYLPFTGR